jgi:hypothetical protein
VKIPGSGVSAPAAVGAAPPPPAPEAPPESTFSSGHLPVPAAGTPHAGRPWVWWLVLLLLIAGAAGAWWMVKHKKPVVIPHQVQAPPADAPPAPDERTARPEATRAPVGEQVQPSKHKTSRTELEHRKQ